MNWKCLVRRVAEILAAARAYGGDAAPFRGGSAKCIVKAAFAEVLSCVNVGTHEDQGVVRLRATHRAGAALSKRRGPSMETYM
jgi:hypothetical protein